MNMSIFNAFPVIAALNDSSSNLFELVNQLNKSTILIKSFCTKKIASTLSKMQHLEGVGLLQLIHVKQFTYFSLLLLQVIIGRGLPMVLVYVYIVT